MEWLLVCVGTLMTLFVLGPGKSTSTEGTNVLLLGCHMQMCGYTIALFGSSIRSQFVPIWLFYQTQAGICLALVTNFYQIQDRAWFGKLLYIAGMKAEIVNRSLFASLFSNNWKILKLSKLFQGTYTLIVVSGSFVRGCKKLRFLLRCHVRSKLRLGTRKWGHRRNPSLLHKDGCAYRTGCIK